ncbi:GNAT family N-acetyltransferase [Lacibacterium aquatile]|uniref:GNAT family N-acetyltransferase n=1 Tax=Lacibacterium aquatile TaxID=1168082 RepID=A0ABW5DNM0_9PROT
MTAPTAASLAFRLAQIADADVIARIQTDGWRDAYRGLMPDRLLDGPLLEDHCLLWRRLLASGSDPMPLLALGGGAEVGFCAMGKSRSGLPYETEVFALYIDTAWHRVGVGRRLMRASAIRAREAGSGSLMLWTLARNARARAFYQRLGGIAVGEEEHCFGGTWLTEVAYAWADIDRLITHATRPEDTP